MRLLVLSDVHANATALETVLAASEGQWERAVCLGDLVGYGPDPNEVIDRLRDLVSAAIRGNHDKAAAGITDLEDFNPVARAALAWTRSQLRPDNLEYLRRLPSGPLEVDGVTLVHGAFHDEDEYVFVRDQARHAFESSPHRLIFFGHTHLQGGFSYRNDRSETIFSQPRVGTDSTILRMEPETRYLLNPGSVGQPRDGDPRAAFAIADTSLHVIEFWRVPYDIGEVQRRMRDIGAPEPLILRLAFGR
jgi:predicted phosphodiesterase